MKLNGRSVGEGTFDYDWKDPQIFSPLPQPNAGSYGLREADPDQKLLLVTYDVDPGAVRLGDNSVAVSVTQVTPRRFPQLQVEKVELHVLFKDEVDTMSGRQTD